MKIGVISDLHLGFRQYGSIEREEDFYNQFLLVCQKINEVGVDMVIVAGDLFDKANPSPEAINYYRKGIASLDADIVVAIKGNHTMLLRDNHYSIDDFFSEEEFEGYYLLDDGCITTYEHGFSSNYDSEYKKYTTGQNIWIDGITYRANSNIDEFLEVQKELAAKKHDGYRILVVHQAFKEFCGFTGEELSINDIDTSKYNVVICGHIHSRKDIYLEDGTWFLQPGSIERMNTVEALDEIENGKGFYVIDTTQDSVNFYQIPCERKFLLGDICIKNEDDLKNHIEELEESLEKLTLPPIISYNYYNYDSNINRIYEYIGRVKNNILLNKSNIYNENEDEVSVEILDTEIPSVLEALQSATKDMNKKEQKLVQDLYENLSNGKEVSKLLSDFFDKNIRKEVKEENPVDDELLEVIEYFENLEV